MEVEARKPDWGLGACAECQGGGTCVGCGGRRARWLLVPCATCKGRGYCPACRGTGETLDVNALRPLAAPPSGDGPFKRFGRARRRAKHALREL